MAKLKEELWKTLQELKEREFKNFKWFLNQDGVLKGFSGIPAARLEKAERPDTVDLMVQTHQGPGALKVTLEVLEKINRNDLVQSLRLKGLQNCVPVSSEYEGTKAKLEAEVKRMIQERRMKICEIERSAELSSKSADTHIAHSREVFMVLQQFVQRGLANLIEAIEEKRKTTQKEADVIIQGLQQEISELTERSAEVEQLAHTENHLDPFRAKNWTEVSVTPPSYGGSVGAALKQLEERFSQEKEKLIAKAKLSRVQQFAKEVTLDPHTANPNLIVSDDGKQVYYADVKQNLADHPGRFNTAINVLGKQSFSSGRFYYEVEVRGKTSWDLGVVKESISRKGSITASLDHGFWTICLKEGGKYNTSAAGLGVKRQPGRVGVFVDYEKGLVSFYDVDAADLIYNFTECSFTEKLYPFFSPGLHHGGKNLRPLIISPVHCSRFETS